MRVVYTPGLAGHDTIVVFAPFPGAARGEKGRGGCPTAVLPLGTELTPVLRLQMYICAGDVLHLPTLVFGRIATHTSPEVHRSRSPHSSTVGSLSYPFSCTAGDTVL